ncbi:LLM class flavin-dependent oxidoreductase [Candidatus Poriferisodalis sp.]|uniref:LLM class flavin-dependent oxidoreductase n=1 Tax=Candidatus Poriferisodalis sp. TaxID=3101277 RepID=UPI003D141858
MTSAQHDSGDGPMQLGASIGQQNMTASGMRDLWKRLDAGGADWISIWDHLYEAPRLGGVLPHFETLSTLGSLVADTRNARIGCLVFYVGYRNAGLLAKAATTLDHFSGGRFTLGLGSGWHETEAAAFGYDFPSLGERFNMLEESFELIRSLLTQERTTYDGRWVRAHDASCLPAPIQERLPIWLGGIGERRTIPMAARLADGALVGTPEMAVERILEYREAGAQGLNVALRAPIRDDALDAYLEEVIPTVQRETA